MSRRKFREDKSKFYGAKQVLQDLNVPAHAVVHDLDVSLAGGGASGYTVFWSSNTFMHSDDISQPLFVPEDGTIDVVYASLPLLAINTFEVDVYLNGSSIFAPIDRPKILSGQSLGADAVPTTTVVTARDALEVQILSTGDNYGRAVVYIVVQ